MFPGPGDPRLIDILGWADETDESGELFIVGIEVTQGIQYARADRHLADPADRMPDNSARLVAGKPAWVRVYVRSWHGEWGVTGTLGIRRRRRFLWPSVATLAPRPPGTIVAPRPQWVESNLAGERSSLAATLDFVIPADVMCGELRLTARAEGPGGPAVKSITIDVTLRRTLRLAGIFVSYSGPANTNPGAQTITAAAPTMPALQTTAADTLTLYPVRSQADFRDAGTLAWTTPLEPGVASDGSCLPNWVALLTAVANQMTADGNQPGFVYYGLLPMALGGGGCGGGGIAVGPNGHITDGLTMAHEIGHACGLGHAPCNVIGDPGYPAYEPYDPPATPQGSIGEYGLDVNNGAIKAPGTYKDFMSYCYPKWISLYHHGLSFGSSMLNPESVCNADLWWLEVAEPHGPLRLTAAAEDVVSLIAVIGADGSRGRAPRRAHPHTATRDLHGQRDDRPPGGRGRRGAGRGAAPAARGPAGCGCGGDARGGRRGRPGAHPERGARRPPRDRRRRGGRVGPRAPPRPPEIARFTCRVVKGAVRAGWRAPRPPTAGCAGRVTARSGGRSRPGSPATAPRSRRATCRRAPSGSSSSRTTASPPPTRRRCTSRSPRARPTSPSCTRAPARSTSRARPCACSRRRSPRRASPFLPNRGGGSSTSRRRRGRALDRGARRGRARPAPARLHRRR